MSEKQFIVRIGERDLIVKTGHLAEQAGGAVNVSTRVLTGDPMRLRPSSPRGKLVANSNRRLGRTFALRTASITSTATAYDCALCGAGMEANSSSDGQGLACTDSAISASFE